MTGNSVEKPVPGEFAIAVQADAIEWAEDLLARGADINEKDVYERDMLSLAVARGLEDRVRWLLDRGADVNVRNARGITPLMHALAMGRTELAHLLLDRGADRDAADERGWTVLMFAVDEFNPEIVQRIVDEGVDIGPRNNRGETALDVAVRLKRAAFVEMLGAEPARRAHAAAVKRQSDLKARAPKPVILGRPKP